MTLPSEQRRKERLAEEERVSGSIQWSEYFPESVSRKLNNGIDKWVGQRQILETQIAEMIRLHSARGRVDYSLSTVLDARSDLEEAFHEERLDLLYALGIVLRELHETKDGQLVVSGARSITYRFQAEEFFEYANDLFLSHRVDWEYINGQLLPRGNQELHVAVVRPTLELLAGETRYGQVEVAYSKALSDLGKGESAHAIASAGVALQEMFEAVGAKGTTIGKLSSDAVRQGLIVGYDQKLSEIADWVNSERSTKGLTHRTSDTKREDAWLMIHVVGALILRLSKGTSRIS
jgi:hypothetical protein